MVLSPDTKPTAAGKGAAHVWVCEIRMRRQISGTVMYMEPWVFPRALMSLEVELYNK